MAERYSLNFIQIRVSPKRHLALVVGILFLALGLSTSPGFGQESPRFEVQIALDAKAGNETGDGTGDGSGSPELGRAFRVGLVNNDPEFDLSKIFRLQFENADERWNVTEAWRPVTPGDSAPPGWIWQASLQAFDLGDQQLPDVIVVYPNQRGLLENEKAESPVISVAGVMPPDAEPAPKPARGVADISTPLWPYLLALALICLAAAVGYLFLRRGRRGLGLRNAGSLDADTQLSPEDWALSEIERRRDLELCVSGESKIIASMASDVIRGYLERRYSIKALEMTTYECMQTLQDFIRINGATEANRAVGAFLDECDLVKFAKVPLPSERWQGIWDDAIEIVRQMKPTAEPRGDLNETMSESVDSPESRDPQAEEAGVR